MTSWIQAMQVKLNEHSDLLEKYVEFGMRLFVFGSAIKKIYPHDLDIVILYNGENIEKACVLRDITVQYLASVFKLPIDCVLLSFDEDKQVGFTLKENANLIFP